MLDVVVGLISALRPEYEDSQSHWAGENSDRQRALGGSLGALGLGYTVLEGHWQEPGVGADGNYEKDNWGGFAGGHDSVEKTFAVLNNSPKKYSPAEFIDILRHAADTYEQYSVMIVAPKSGDVQDSFGNSLLAGHGYYYQRPGYDVPVDQGTFHADMVGDWVEENGEVSGRGYSRTPGRKGRTFVFNYFDFKEAYDHVFNIPTAAKYLHSSVQSFRRDPAKFFGGGLISSSGLGRLWDLMNKSRVGFISAFREFRSLEENVAYTKDLKDQLRSAGFGFVPIEGEWEVEGSPVQYDASFAVSHPHLGKDDFTLVLCGLAGDYDQDSVMVVEGGVAEFYSPDDPLSPVHRAENFRTSMLDEWVEDVAGRVRGKSTLKRGPKGRSFAFSAGRPVGGFDALPTFAKPAFSASGSAMVQRYRGRFSTGPESEVVVSDGGGEALARHRNLVVADRFGVFNRAVELPIRSARGVVLNSVNDFIEQTAGIDVAIISAFTPAFKKADGGGVDESHREHLLRNYANTDRLWKTLNGHTFSVITVNGFWLSRNKQTKESWNDSVEKSFMVLNVGQSLETPVFFGVFLDLIQRDKFNQESALIKPAEAMVFLGQELEPETAYWLSQDGVISRAGTLKKVDREASFRDFTDYDGHPGEEGEAAGGSQTFGEGETFAYSCVFRYPVDFTTLRVPSLPHALMSRMALYSSLTQEWKETGKVDLRVNPIVKLGLGVSMKSSYQFSEGVVFRPFVQSRRELHSRLPTSKFDQWKGAYMIYSQLGRGSLIDWLELQRFDDLAQSFVVSEVETMMSKHPDALIASATGPRSLEAWRLYEVAQKLKAGGLSYKETVNMLAKESGVPHKEIKDIIGTSEEWREGVFDYGLEPLHQDEKEELMSKLEREYIGEGEPVFSGVSQRGAIHDQFLSGEISPLAAVDALVSSGVDRKEAVFMVQGWSHEA
jgi:hypothetical protein